MGHSVLEVVWVVAGVIVVLGGLIVYGQLISRRMSPEQRDAERERGLLKIFEDWFANPGELEAHRKRRLTDQGVAIQRRFDYYAQLRRDGIDSTYAFVASARPILGDEPDVE
jgi:hypothetical protein